jgi:hypothetical protein
MAPAFGKFMYRLNPEEYGNPDTDIIFASSVVRDLFLLPREIVRRKNALISCALPKPGIQDSRFKIQDSRFKIQDSKFKIQDSRFKIQDSRLGLVDEFLISIFLKRQYQLC